MRFEKTAALVRQARQRAGLRPGGLARLLGVATDGAVSKLSRRIVDFEEGRTWIGNEILGKIVQVLGLDKRGISDLLQVESIAEKRAWEIWAAKPIRPYLIWRAMATVWCREELPDHVVGDRKLMLEFASKFTRQRFVVTLRTSNVESFWFDASGQVYLHSLDSFGDEPTPWVMIGEDRVETLFGGSDRKSRHDFDGID